MFASNADRLAFTTQDYSCDVVFRFERDGLQSELMCDDIDHAMTLSGHWIDRGANYAEIFRVNADGSLKATIGAYGELAA